jgi:hypothetical protein
MTTKCLAKDCSVGLLVLELAAPLLAADGTTNGVEIIDGFRDTPMLPGGKY